MAMHGDGKGIEELQRATGTKDKVAQCWIDVLLKRVDDLHRASPQHSKADIVSEIQTWFDQQPGEKLNPLLNITGLDPSQDTPVELLHTILLGVMKYIWHFLNTSQWSETDRHLLAIWLQSTDISGLTVPPIRAGYMIQYKNNLIGKHFKTLMQPAILGPDFWVPEIDDMDYYLEQLKIAVANLLDAFDTVDPLRILVKIKLHLLAHLPDDIRRFGPAIRFVTEIYEANNGVFQLSSIYSNRLAPSCDISLKFASMSRVKQRIYMKFD
ncbi:FAD-binding-3 domain-containing protein [Mycena sanguinolenta]|uniref:FAD-binding-3 domain-containing protein n=1 Tax=Mycena sanguinolenta TaxID=230812 RepID=A0A8H7CDH6_9AGAR|nr:FAD-binding-3 domain-containing protein [Mycena sanguinolenta]